MSNQLLIVISCLIIVTSLICLVRIILGLKNKFNATPVNVNKNKKNIIAGNNASVINMEMCHETSKNDPGDQNETKNASTIQDSIKQAAEREAHQKKIKIERNVNSSLTQIDDGSGQKMHELPEANIRKVNKVDGIQTKPVDPGKLALTGHEQFYKLDIVIEKTPINKALNKDHAGEKR